MHHPILNGQTEKSYSYSQDAPISLMLLLHTMVFFPYLCISLFASLVAGQFSGDVGPTTSTKSKEANVCSVLDYGGSVGSTDIGPAISSAFTNCVLKHSASTLYIPKGNYDMATWVTLSGGIHWALRIDGILTRTSATHGHMFWIDDANDFEFFSSNSAGAIQGNGYECRNDGPRLVRIVNSTNWSFHDFALVNSPEYHLIVDGGSNAEIYNLVIRGADIGASDGIDISGNNHWVHDVEVTNRDECVTVKDPSSNFLIERIWCNQSGGCAMGSLGKGTAIENIIYRNVYSNGCDGIYYLKTNGGSGYVKNCLFENFTSIGSAYGLVLNEYWGTAGDGAGVKLSNMTFKNWDGIIQDGEKRAAYRFNCADEEPCTDITLENVNIWAEDNVGQYECESAYGTGACLKASGTKSYAVTYTSYTKPAKYTTPPTMSGNLASGFATNVSIPIPTIPETFYPGLPQITPLAKNL